MTAVSMAAAGWVNSATMAVLGPSDSGGWARQVADPHSLLRADAAPAVRSANDWLWNSFAIGQDGKQDVLRSGHDALDLMRIGVGAMSRGEGAMRFWTQGMLGVQNGHPTEFVVDIEKEAASPFSQGLNKRWDLLTNGLMKEMPSDVRQRYQGVLNDEAAKALQMTMRYDEALEEYAPVNLKGFSAAGGAATTIHGALSDEARKAFQADVAKGQAGQPGGVVLDTGVIRNYFQAKGQAATKYAERYEASLRPGIVALLMGRSFAQQWIAGELGYVPGQGVTDLAGAAHPNADGVVQRWNSLTADKLDRMPSQLRGRIDKVANGTFANVLREAFVEDKKLGKYGDVKAHLWAAEGDRPNFKFWLNGDNTLGYEQIVKHDCISEIILPIVGAVLTIIPGTQAIGIALNTALAVKNGVETGNWLGAAVGVVGGAVGLGGLGAFGSGALQAGFQAAGTAMKVGMGAYGLANAIDSGNLYGALGSATSLASAGAGLAGYGDSVPVQMGLNAVTSGISLAKGIDEGNPFSIASGVLGLAGGAATGVKWSAKNDTDSALGAASYWGVKPTWSTMARVWNNNDTIAGADTALGAIHALEGMNSMAATGFGVVNHPGAAIDGFALGDTLLRSGLHGYGANDAATVNDLVQGSGIGALASNPMTRYLNQQMFAH